MNTHIQTDGDSDRAAAVLMLPRNTKGTDWFVGDLHGELDKLQAFLAFAKFDPVNDRLIGVGDLVDRGPNPAGLLEFFGQNLAWFYSCIGNHDSMMLDALTNPSKDQRHISGSVWHSNGGGWIGKVARDELMCLVQALERMPLAIEVELTNGVKVGVVHAEVPLDTSWSDVGKATIDSDDILDVSDKLGACLLWSRRRTYAAYTVTCNASARSINPDVAAHVVKLLSPVPGIDLLITGHTNCIPKRPQWIENLLWIDTGAGYKNGVLSFINPVNGDCIQVRGRCHCRRIQVNRISLDAWRAKAAKYVSKSLAPAVMASPRDLE